MFMAQLQLQTSASEHWRLLTWGLTAWLATHTAVHMHGSSYTHTRQLGAGTVQYGLCLWANTCTINRRPPPILYCVLGNHAQEQKNGVGKPAQL